MTNLAPKAAASRPYFPTRAPLPFCSPPHEFSPWTIFHLYTVTQCSGSRENLNPIRRPFLERLETCLVKTERLTLYFRPGKIF